MIKGRKVTICLPCRNEGDHLRQVIDKVPDYIDEVIIISNKSTDNTVKIAKQIGGKVKVIEDNRTEKGIGYGYAHITGIKQASGDIIVGADGDATYPLKDIEKITNYLLKNDLDFISCNRYPMKNGTKIPLKLRIGVKLLNLEILLLYGIKLNDCLSGMWVFRKNIAKKLNLSKGDWNLSPQIKLNAAKDPGIRFSEYSITQHNRLGDTKQHYFKTGYSHFIWIFKNKISSVNHMISLWKISTIIFLIIAGILKLILASGQHLSIIGNATFDDRHFINQASSILQGHWLGTYNNMTLIKGPFYPIFIALSNLIHAPLLLSEQVLYLLACAIFLISMSPLINLLWIVKRSHKFKYIIISILGLLLIFNPISTDVSPATRVVRNGIYPALTLLTISLFIALLSYRKSVAWKYLIISIFSGIILSSFWLTREEGVWLIPFCVLILAYTFGLIFVEKKTILHWKFKIALLTFPFLILWLSIFTISKINYSYYGVKNVTEFNTPQFLDAYSSLTRVGAGKWYAQIPVSQAQLNAIYKVSPLSLKLKSYLEGKAILPDISLTSYLYPNYHNEIAGGWFMWAFRNAVASAGYYKNGRTAMNYYQSLANQINKACNEKKINCLYSTGAMYPPFNKGYVKPFFDSMGNSFKFLSGFESYNPKPSNIIGSNNSLALFSKISNEPATNSSDHFKISILKTISQIYQTIFPMLTYVSITLLIGLIIWKKAFKDPFFILILLFAIVVLSRMILLSAVNITSFPAINTLYFSSAYPPLIIFDFLIIIFSYNLYKMKQTT